MNTAYPTQPLKEITMKTKEVSTTDKAEQAAKKHFDSNEHIEELAVILKEETGAWVSVHRRDEGQLMRVDFPITYDLEYAAQCLLRRFDVVRTEVVYA
jgi:hypothetical protein